MTFKKIITILIFVAPFSHHYAQNYLPKIETNRLKSTGGAGVGSILLEEASTLNPAASAFFNIGSVYLQTSSHEFDPNIDGEDSLINFIASDATGPKAGSASYSKLKSGGNTITQYGVSFATPIGKKSSIGISYSRRKEELNINNSIMEESYNIVNIGVLHNVSESFSFGVVLQDAIRDKKNNSRLLIGGQYAFGSYINFMLDIGSDYKENLSDNFLVRSSVQVRVFNDFYIRFGVFDDGGENSTGNGIGLAWIQPRLSFEASIKNSDFEANTLINQQQTELKETTFSISYRF